MTIKTKIILLSIPFLTLIAFTFPYTKEVTRIKQIDKLPNTGKNEVEWALMQLKQLSLEQRIAQFFMVSVHPEQGEEQLIKTLGLVRDLQVGGVIFFQSDKSVFKRTLSRLDSVAQTPLLVGMDAEWGTNMRLSDGERFPYAYTLGAADDTNSTSHIAELMAQECRDLGIHVSFAPVADVNSDPDNPVIGFRSFGQNSEKVAAHVSAFVQATEANGVMACLKHFPGHGDTDKDSHLELPTVSRSISELQNTDFIPFQHGITGGASGVMIAHLNVPALDPSETPSSFSADIIKTHLRRNMNFSGLVFSDALNMKAVSSKYGADEVSVKAFEAGCDILLCPEDVSAAIQVIAKKVKDGNIARSEIDERCLKVLRYKYRYVVSPKSYVKRSITEREFRKQEVFDRAITVLRNDNEILPFKRLDDPIECVSIGTHTNSFQESIDLFDDVPYRHYPTLNEVRSEKDEQHKKNTILIYALHASTVRSKNNFGFGVSSKELASLPKGKKTILVLFGNPLYFSDLPKENGFDAIITAYENNPLVQKSVAQLLYGSIPALGKLPMTVNADFKSGHGIEFPCGGRLKFSFPEEVGIASEKLNGIDQIAQNAIEKKAFPGCQILVAVRGKIIYRKSFGKHTYEGVDSVRNTNLYDLASVSKIVGSTVGVMRLQTQGLFSLDRRLRDYLPDLTSGSEYGRILLRDMMAHQAGLTAWIPFYKRTLKNGELSERIYSKEEKGDFDLQVAKKLFIRRSYTDSIYEQILKTPLGPKKYEYSDLGYYFIKKILEKESGRAFEDYLTKEIYRPMGLRSMCYRPLNYFDLTSIVPTEDDQVFRKQLIHGYVHDPGAAMLGGVGGHAGVFSNATDLAALMQMLLNKGNYGGVQYLKETVVQEYTRAQFSGNRRGAGFDRPTASGGGPCHERASQESFGHSGFTGTLVWADPKYDINYVFLSNRVCPDQNNWKIRDMNIRTEIQRVIYDAVLAVH